MFYGGKYDIRKVVELSSHLDRAFTAISYFYDESRNCFINFTLTYLTGLARQPNPFLLFPRMGQYNFPVYFY